MKINSTNRSSSNSFEFSEKTHLFLQPAKCLFEKSEINFLGMHLNHYGITIDPSKIAGLYDWPCTLGNVKEVRKVLEVLGYQCPPTVVKP